MAWKETWLSEDRPDPSAIPAQYSPRPTGRGVQILAYFAVLTLAYIGSLYAFGQDPTVILGLPMVAWLSVILAFLYLFGMYHFLLGATASDVSASVNEEREAA